MITSRRSRSSPSKIFQLWVLSPHSEAAPQRKLSAASTNQALPIKGRVPALTRADAEPAQVVPPPAANALKGRVRESGPASSSHPQEDAFELPGTQATTRSVQAPPERSDG